VGNASLSIQREKATARASEEKIDVLNMDRDTAITACRKSQQEREKEEGKENKREKRVR
jgi:hypothetical protein